MKLIYIPLIIAIMISFCSGCITTPRNQSLPLPDNNQNASAIITQSQVSLSTLAPGWTLHKVPEDNFEIAIPDSWSTSNRSVSSMSSNNIFNKISHSISEFGSTPMDKVLYSSSPDEYTMIMVSGFNTNDNSISTDNVLAQFSDAKVSEIESFKPIWLNDTTFDIQEIGIYQYQQLMTLHNPKFETTNDTTIYTTNGFNLKRTGLMVGDSRGWLSYVEIFAYHTDNRVYIIEVSHVHNSDSDPETTSTVASILGSFTSISEN